MAFKDFLTAGLDRAGLKSQAEYVDFGFGQVEPNHLSAQRTGQIYTQLPAAPTITMLEQGQFVKYDYAANDNGIGEVNFTGNGEWMLVYNEIKLYKNHLDGTKQWDCEFVMHKDDYQARIYSPYDYEQAEIEYHDWHRLNGTDEKGKTSMTVNTYVSLDIEGKTVTIDGERYAVTGDAETGRKFSYKGKEYELDENGQSKTQVPVEYTYDDVTADVADIYEMGWTNDPWKRLGIYRERKMPKGTTMVPRVFKTNVGDIFTTNTIGEKEVSVGDVLTPRAKDGILAKATEDAAAGTMKWQVVKVYTMPDNQKGVKVMRIA